jgi:hypothetical protein
VDRSRLIVRMSLRWVIPGELLSRIARFRSAHGSHPKPETSRSSAENQPTATVSKLVCLKQGVQSILMDEEIASLIQTSQEEALKVAAD